MFNVFDRFGILFDIKYSRGISPNDIEQFKNERSLGVWYLIYEYIDRQIICYLKSINEETTKTI